MALRDPGAPRRNPLFAVDEPGPDACTDAPEANGDEWDDWADDPIFGGSDNPLFGAPGSAMGPLISAFTEAGPEAAEHLVNAAHEFTLAIKVVVDAFERTLAEQRAVFAAEHPTQPADPADGRDADFEIHLDNDPFVGPAGPPVREPRVGVPRVQNIDLE
ncbi:MAG: hypothetical protein ACXW2C_09340 [Acidimicrobiia bacterium]